jgi:hypothetical protein
MRMAPEKSLSTLLQKKPSPSCSSAGKSKRAAPECDRCAVAPEPGIARGRGLLGLVEVIVAPATDGDRGAVEGAEDRLDQVVFPDRVGPATWMYARSIIRVMGRLPQRRARFLTA